MDDNALNKPSSGQAPPNVAGAGAPGSSPSWQGPGQSPAPVASSGLDPKVGGLLSYLLSWVGGLIMYLTQSDREVRFHAAQSVITFGGITVLSVVLSVLGNIGFGLGLLFGLANILLAFAAFGLWIYLSIQGYSLNHVRLPIAGALAEQWAAK